MQDLRSVGGGGGRIFGVDRRFRSNINQPLKCPRCESSNTKFCYYNNYNLSQPRHFCKNCRRYWTKGGILRNVPVGGGCRKTKRSKSKPSPEVQKEKNSTSHSSSESSNFTATATATATVTETALVSTSTPEATFLNFPNPGFNFVPSIMETLDQSSAGAGGILPETGNYTSLLTASNPGFLGFDFSEFSPLKLHHQNQSHQQQDQQEKVSTSMIEELKLQELTSTSYLDQTVPDNSRNGGLTALEWQNNGGQGLFDLPSSVDQDYWNQSQWNDTDDPLYH